MAPVAEGSSGATVRVAYRILRTNRPTPTDFTSNAALGRRLENPSLQRQRLWEGISVWGTLAQARRLARRYPRTGQWISELRIPVDASIEVGKTLGPGHYTLWGDTVEIARCIVSIVSAR